MLKRYWMETILLIIAAGGLGMAAYNTLASPNGASEIAVQENIAVVEDGPQLSSTTELTQPLLTIDDADAEDEDLFELEFGDEGDENESLSMSDQYPEEMDDEDEFEDRSDSDEVAGAEAEEDAEDERELDSGEEAPEDEDGAEFEEDGDDDGEDGEVGEIDFFAIAAQTIGIEIEALDEGRDQGKSVADIARENGVDPQTVSAALVDAELKLIEGLVDSGQMKRTDARERLEASQRHIPFELENPYPEVEIVAAQALGVETETIFVALEAGQTLKTIAEESGSNGQTVIDAYVAAQTSYVDAMIQAGLEEAEFRDEWLQEIQAGAEIMVNQGFEAWEQMMDAELEEDGEMDDEDEGGEDEA